jgi:hypothetical protein
MSNDNVAVRWSDYDEFRSRIEYDTRNKISEDLQRKIAIVKESFLPNEFLAGLELANAIVLRQTEDIVLDESPQTLLP